MERSRTFESDKNDRSIQIPEHLAQSLHHIRMDPGGRSGIQRFLSSVVATLNKKVYLLKKSNQEGRSCAT
jgi:hypothetical protein